MNIFAITITTIAGLSTLLGFIFINNTKNQDKIIALSLSFSASVMISLSILELIPDAFKELIKTHTTFHTILIILIFINIGAIVTLILDAITHKINKNTLYTVGIISVIAIILHNIPEGIITYLAGNTNKRVGISLMIAIAMHNIPEGISIAIPLYYSTKNKLKTLKYLIISASSEIFGALIAAIFLQNKNINFISYISLIIAGIMIFLALFEQIPIIKKIKEKNKIKIFILGIIIIIYITIKIM